MSELEEKLYSEMRRGIACKASAISAGIVENGKIIFDHSIGTTSKESEDLITANTLFDLASLTKVVATLPSILQLIASKRIELDEDVSSYLPGISHQNITILQLLTHTSGMKSFYPFYQDIEHNKITLICKLLSLKDNENQGEVVYSDLNFILLGHVVEEVTECKLEEYTKNAIFKPLGMNDTLFNPVDYPLKRIAATEFREDKKLYDHGYVHDENALFFNGVAGHAGLFSTLKDLVKFVCAIQQPDGFTFTKGLLNESVSKELFHHYQRGLGWQFNTTYQMGRKFGKKSFGHTGFTGTSIWFNKEMDKSLIMLTNRVHYGRSSDISSLRQKLHDLAFDY